MTLIARPETEAELLSTARAGTAVHLEKLVRAYRRADPAADRGAIMPAARAAARLDAGGRT